MRKFLTGLLVVGFAGVLVSAPVPVLTRDLNLKTDFGAKGDGVTDDYVALTNAIYTINQRTNGGGLYIPNGYYKFSQPWVLGTNGAKIEIYGDRAANTRLLFTGTNEWSVIAAGTLSEAGGYYIHDLALSGEGNSNPGVSGIMITNFSARRLHLENFEVHNYSKGTGIYIDQTHGVILRNILSHYNVRGFIGGTNYYFNGSEMNKVFIENCTDTNYVAHIKNATGVTWNGESEIENNASGIYFENCEFLVLENNYFELNGHLTANVMAEGIKGLIIKGNHFNGATTNTLARALQLGNNNFASQGGGFVVRDNQFYNYSGDVFTIGMNGTGPRDPVFRDNTYWACIESAEPFDFVSVVEGKLIREEIGVKYYYLGDGTRIANYLGELNGPSTVIMDFSLTTNKAIALPVSESGNLPPIGTNKAGIIVNKTNNRLLFTADGVNWNILGYGDGNLQSVSGGTGVLNTVTYWTGNGFQLSTNSPIIISGNSVWINTGTNTFDFSTKLAVTDGGTNSMSGTSSTVLFRNGGISTNANVLELSSNLGGTFFLARNSGDIGLPALGANLSLLGLNSSTNITSVIIIGATYDETTATLTIGSAGQVVTNFSVGTMSPMFTVSDPNTFPLLAAVDQGGHRFYGWNDTSNKVENWQFGSGFAVDPATGIVTVSGGSGGSATNAYSTIMEEGVALPAQTNLNFRGAGITASNDGAGGKTDVDLDSDLNSLAASVGTGIWVVTGVGTGANRSIVGSQGITTSNGDGVAGNPTVSMDIPSLIANTAPSPANDDLVIYSAANTAHQKIKIDSLMGGKGVDNSYRTITLTCTSDGVETENTLFTVSGLPDLGAVGLYVELFITAKNASTIAFYQYDLYTGVSRDGSVYTAVAELMLGSNVPFTADDPSAFNIFVQDNTTEGGVGGVPVKIIVACTPGNLPTTFEAHVKVRQAGPGTLTF